MSAGFGSAADCLQTIPAVLYVLMNHADNYESAVIAAVNDTKDNDTIASIVGAILGALHGRAVIPERWIEGITSSSIAGSDNPENTDRKVIERMAAEAIARFC